MVCCNCGTNFESSNKDKKYCCSKCYNLSKQKRHYAKSGKGSGICIKCGISFKKTNAKQKYCTLVCFGKSQRKYLDIPDCILNSHRKVDKNIGYVRVYCPDHREANNRGYVYEHRLLMEQFLGRELLKTEVVHHKNKKRWDNRLENLEVMDRRAHSILTALERTESNGSLL